MQLAAGDRMCPHTSSTYRAPFLIRVASTGWARNSICSYCRFVLIRFFITFTVKSQKLEEVFLYSELGQNSDEETLYSAQARKSYKVSDTVCYWPFFENSNRICKITGIASSTFLDWHVQSSRPRARALLLLATIFPVRSLTVSEWP